MMDDCFSSVESLLGTSIANGGQMDLDSLLDNPVEIIACVNSLKEKGNSFFKLGDFKSASLLYDQARSSLCLGFPLSSSDEDAFDSLLVSVNLNLAACVFKNKDFDQVHSLCSFVLKGNPTHVKALYRRALALVNKGLMVEAHSDLVIAALCEPNNKEVLRELGTSEHILCCALSEQRDKGKRLCNISSMVMHSTMNVVGEGSSTDPSLEILDKHDSLTSLVFDELVQDSVMLEGVYHTSGHGDECMVMNRKRRLDETCEMSPERTRKQVFSQGSIGEASLIGTKDQSMEHGSLPKIISTPVNTPECLEDVDSLDSVVPDTSSASSHVHPKSQKTTPLKFRHQNHNCTIKLPALVYETLLEGKEVGYYYSHSMTRITIRIHKQVDLVSCSTLDSSSLASNTTFQEMELVDNGEEGLMESQTVSQARQTEDILDTSSNSCILDLEGLKEYDIHNFIPLFAFSSSSNSGLRKTRFKHKIRNTMKHPSHKVHDLRGPSSKDTFSCSLAPKQRIQKANTLFLNKTVDPEFSKLSKFRKKKAKPSRVCMVQDMKSPPKQGNSSNMHLFCRSLDRPKRKGIPFDCFFVSKKFNCHPVSSQGYGCSSHSNYVT